MAFSLVAKTLMRGSGTASAAIDTTGATILLVCVSDEGGVSAGPSLTDSKSNVWFRIQEFGVGSNKHAFIFISQATPTVGSGHTFTVTGSFPSSAVLTYSATSPTINIWTAAFGTGLTLQPGSLTPSASGALLVTMMNSLGVGATGSIDSSFTIQESATETASFDAIFAADLIQGTAAAVNPTWTSSNEACSTILLALIEGSGGGGGGGSVAYGFAG